MTDIRQFLKTETERTIKAYMNSEEQLLRFSSQHLRADAQDQYTNLMVRSFTFPYRPDSLLIASGQRKKIGTCKPELQEFLIPKFEEFGGYLSNINRAMGMMGLPKKNSPEEKIRHSMPDPKSFKDFKRNVISAGGKHELLDLFIRNPDIPSDKLDPAMDVIVTLMADADPIVSSLADRVYRTSQLHDGSPMGG